MDITSALSVFGTGMDFLGKRKAGKAAAESGKAAKAARGYEADALRVQASNVIGIGQRKAINIRKQFELIQSRNLAKAAAGGGSASDASIVRAMADIREEGIYREQVARYGAEEDARQLRVAAVAKEYAGDVAEFEGQQKKSAYNMASLSSLIEGAGTLYERYGGGGPEDDGWDPSYSDSDIGW